MHKGWKIAGWIFLAWFVIAGGLWIIAVPIIVLVHYFRQPREPAPQYLADDGYTEDDVLAAGMIGYWWGHHK